MNPREWKPATAAAACDNLAELFTLAAAVAGPAEPAAAAAASILLEEDAAASAAWYAVVGSRFLKLEEAPELEVIPTHCWNSPGLQVTWDAAKPHRGVLLRNRHKAPAIQPLLFVSDTVVGVWEEPLASFDACARLMAHLGERAQDGSLELLKPREDMLFLGCLLAAISTDNKFAEDAVAFGCHKSAFCK